MIYGESGRLCVPFALQIAQFTGEITNNPMWITLGRGSLEAKAIFFWF